jgi:hypothetical protein
LKNSSLFPHQQFISFFSWIEENALLYLTLFLIVFIPLWPKIPVFQPIPGYIVRVRLEDFAVGLTTIVWLIQVLRKKVEYKTPLNMWIGLYFIAGFFSLLSAFFWIRTIPLELPHVAKAFLHLFRYAEYFLLFFFAFAAVKKKQHLQLFLSVFLITVVGVTVYGVGQKYWQFPVYSTMNWEFSSGVALELANQHARVQSTFAGHYDFAIYIALILPVIVVLLYNAKKKKEFIPLSIVFLMGLWSLIVSGLRSAFLSYVASAGVVTLLFALRQMNWKKRLQWFSLRMSAIYFVTAVLFAVFGNNLFALLNHAFTGLILPKQQNMTNEETIISQYQLPVLRDQKNQASSSANLENKAPLQLSGCALQREVSLCIRLESLWPQAIKGFLRQPLLGSGYSSLNKRDFHHLSEADGADNNYLRILGETGILGFASFFAILAKAVQIAVKKIRLQEDVSAWLGIAYLGIIVAVLINALLIDVFAASKVAFTFWALTGMMLGYWKLENKE